MDSFGIKETSLRFKSKSFRLSPSYKCLLRASNRSEKDWAVCRRQKNHWAILSDFTKNLPESLESYPASPYLAIVNRSSGYAYNISPTSKFLKQGHLEDFSYETIMPKKVTMSPSKDEKFATPNWEHLTEWSDVRATQATFPKKLASFHLPLSKPFWDPWYIHLYFNIQINQPNVGT